MKCVHQKFQEELKRLIDNILSIIKKSNSPQATSVKNCLISPFFLGPLQIIASSLLSIKNPIDITPKFSLIYIGYQPLLLECTSLVSNPIILGILGPQMSISNKPTSNPLDARIWANYDETVLLPTPPLPDKTSILCLTYFKFSMISELSKNMSYIT